MKKECKYCGKKFKRLGGHYAAFHRDEIHGIKEVKKEPGLTAPQEQHLVNILTKFKEMATDKYTKGVKEHGGNLWLNPHIIDEAINESIDLFVYLVTLKEQLVNIS